MIIKRKQAQAYATRKASLPVAQRSPAHAPHPQADWEEQYAQAAPVEDETYQDVTPIDFETGKLTDRRNNDRRQMFRRDGDIELISRAEEESNAIRENAARQGMEEGLTQSQQVIDQLHDAIHGLMKAREDAMAEAADGLASMAIEIAQRIIKTEVSCDSELVMSLVRDTIAKVGRDQRQVTIKVNAIDFKLVKERVKTDEDIPSELSVTVNEDNTVNPGSCMVESRAGLIDARFETQLEVLKRLALLAGPGG